MGELEPDPGEDEHQAVRVRLLSPDEWQLARDARFAALRDAPDSFLPWRPPESSWTEARWRDSWRSGLWAVARSGGRTVGLARLSQDGMDAYIESVWTDPRYRRLGIASALVRRLIASKRPPGRGAVYVWVITPNAAAFRLYESLGFVPTKVTQHLGNLDRVEEQLRFSGDRSRW
jgi:ribosomal protein S18 acetylase RimI-like enzyme